MDNIIQQSLDAMPHRHGSSQQDGYSETPDLNLVALLRQRALTAPDKCAYVFLTDGASSEESINYGQLDAQARAVATQLQMLEKAGERALLLYPAGLDYIVAFLGCLYSGVIAVPAYPPSRHHAYRLKAIIHDASPSVILTTKDLCEKLQENHEKSWNCDELMWLATDTLKSSSADSWVPPALELDSLAFLQYTSGSTGDPKGVMVSHGNLMANQKIIKKAFNHTQETVVAGWLPLYHDMGLIGNVLQPLYLGATAILMAPLVFLEQPIRWLKAISKFRASTSGGPNFAYELCIRKITPEQKRELDLSCWTLAFNGSEPVRAKTLAQFHNAFAECGFRQESFFPCYGLAESTLFVTGQRLSDRSKLQCAQFADANQLATQHYSQNQISCGHAWDDHAICVVNPETHMLCPDGEEGEIWTAGPSVAKGYWNRPEVTDNIFLAALKKPELPGDAIGDAISQEYFNYSNHQFLRTGDLGIIEQGNLFVTGRIKDLIILRGRNYYPQDLEQAVNEGVVGIRSHCCAAFSVERAGEERLIIAVEIKRRTILDHKAQKMFSEMRQVLAEVSDAPISELLLVSPGSIMKTSSGKIQRQAIKQAYLANQLRIVASSGASDTLFSPASIDASDKDGISSFSSDALLELPNDQALQLISHFLQVKLSKLLGVPKANIPLTSAIRFLGLDSLRVVELKHEIDASLDTEIPLSLLLSDQSITDFARILLKAVIDAPSTQVYSSVDALQSKDTVGLSCAQQAIWTVHQLEPRSIIYNLHICLHLQGFLNEGILRSALNILLQRHSQLRTCYWMSGESVQQSVISCDDMPAYLSVVDATGWDRLSFQEDLARRVREPFNLSHGPMLRITSYQQGEQDHVLLFCAHHVAVDLWTGLILLNDLKIIIKGLISGQNPDLPELTSGYHDFVTWQRGYLHSNTCQYDWEYWQKKLAGELPLLELPTDLPRPRVPTHQGASKTLRLDTNLTYQVKQLGQKHGATLFMTLLAIYKVLLHRYTHQEDIIVGTASNGRPQARFKYVAGNFVNPVALRSSPSPLLSFTTYLAQVRDTVVDALSHADYPFSLLVERLQPERSADHWPIYQTWLMLQQGRSGIDDGIAHLALGEEGERINWGDWWTVASERIDEQVEGFDLRLMAAEDEHGLLLSFKYRTDLFMAETIARMANHFRVLLEGIIAQPEALLSEFPLLMETERVQQLIKWNSLSMVVPEDKSLHALFEAQVIKAPMQMAISCNGVQLSYSELNAEANQLAHYLREQGVGPEVVVGLYLKRSLDMVIGILGILKAGGAYVPIDADFPVKRMESLLKDSGAMLLITHQMLSHKISEHELPVFCLDSNRETLSKRSKENPRNLSCSEHLAYIIYTSGSTGKPKGVAITHGNVIHSTYARFHTYQAHVEGFLLLSSYTFDSSVAGIFWTLCQGGCIYMPAEGEEKDPRILGKILSNGHVTHLLSLPSLYGLLLDNIAQDLLEKLKVIIVAGEPCSSDLVVRHNQKLSHVSLFNEYGPTEGTVWSSVYQIQAEDAHNAVPIGKPIQNVQLYLLDSHLNPVPIGVSGELYIGGAGLARGYLHSPDLTAERFIPNPFDVNAQSVGNDDLLNSPQTSSRLYRTGDLARFRPDGNIEFLDRIDHQVKIRGFRIELGEIEAKLRQHPGIKEAVVLAREDRPGDKQLVAYLIADVTQFLGYSQSNTGRLEPDLLRDDLLISISAPKAGRAVIGKSLSNQYIQKFLKDNLPDFMVPPVYVFMETFPLLSNGKLHRNALPIPESTLTLSDQEWIEPSNSIERSLLAIWKEMLNVNKPFGIHENFFDLGGHSLLAIQVMGRIQDDFNIELPVASIFEATTIAQLAVVVAQQQIDGQDLNVLESLLDEFEQLPDETGIVSDLEMASLREDS